VGCTARVWVCLQPKNTPGLYDYTVIQVVWGVSNPDKPWSRLPKSANSTSRQHAETICRLYMQIDCILAQLDPTNTASPDHIPYGNFSGTYHKIFIQAGKQLCTSTKKTRHSTNTTQGLLASHLPTHSACAHTNLP
jgi:hypothetical protein